jgi:hypothetical protein
MVTHGSTDVAVLPNGEAAGFFDWTRPVSAVVLVRGSVAGSLSVTQAAALVVPSRVSGKTLRAEPAASGAAGFWARRVAPGEAVRLDLITDGLRLPDDTDWIDVSATEAAALTESAQRSAPQKGQRASSDTAGVPQIPQRRIGVSLPWPPLAAPPPRSDDGSGRARAAPGSV